MLNLMLIYQVIAGLSLLKAAHAVNVPDPIAHFPLNSKYETREINNRQPQGTPVRVSLAPGPNNKTGGSYQFTVGQNNSYIEFPNDGGLNANRSITVLCWVNYAGSGPTNQYIVAYINLAQDKAAFVVFIVNGILVVYMKDRAYEIASIWIDTQPLEPGAWHLIGASYDDDTGIARLYVDDKTVAQKNLTANGGVATTDQLKLYVGGLPKAEPPSANFNGRITNLRIFDVALHLDQINAVQFPVEAPAECSCYNGGSCAPRDDGYMCICPAGYIGEHCEWQKQGCYHEVCGPRKNKAMVNASVNSTVKRTEMMSKLLLRPVWKQPRKNNWRSLVFADATNV
ncbi:hypothetical protein OS493_009252 [Desmophyllum pertusum]|uniref:Uncharacterized protein n=1 Tax=Desmophyllum pertusum TaxID=174260 RepID=A0A9W9Z2J9_9CNID|nr:hypothetical protein OS493_009252 [Desmophyllum pertusum]